MNRQDIVNNINNSLVDYNVRWSDVMYMADKAIMKINSYMCANYPLMSGVLLSPDHTYTVRINNIDIPIFPERYIITVVIPFIQAEVLARDEEFTTIYNKYVLEYEGGLFDMVSNEYNKVPKIFRQPKESGVFFTTEQTRKQFSSDYIENIPEFKCSIHYHVSNPDILMTTQFTTDVIKYDYGTVVPVLNCVNNPQFKGISDYEKAFFNIHTENILYKFKGWSYNERIKNIDFSVDDFTGSITPTIVIKGDVHLYAVWEEESIFDMNNGVASVKNIVAPMIHNLLIPDSINGYPVQALKENFDKDMINLTSVVLPKTLMIIYSNTFTQSTLMHIEFPVYNYLFNAPNITLETGAITLNDGCKLTELYLPYSIRTIKERGINILNATGDGVGNSLIYISCENFERPVEWNEEWYSGTHIHIAWGVSNG